MLAKQVQAPGGTVTFVRDGQVMPGCSAVSVGTGQAACTSTVPTGSHTFRAVYTAGPGFQDSQSPKAVVSVT